MLFGIQEKVKSLQLFYPVRIHGTKLLSGQQGISVLLNESLGGDAVRIVAHKHVGKVCTVVYPVVLLCVFVEGHRLVPVGEVLNGLDHSLEVGFVEVGDGVTFRVVQADLVRSRLQEGVGEVLHHVPYINRLLVSETVHNRYQSLPSR